MNRDDGLDHDNPHDPDPLHVEAYEDGYVAGVASGIARERRRDRLAAIALAAAIGALLVVAFAYGRASAAPRPAQTTGRFDLSPLSSAGPTGAPRSGKPVKVLEAAASRVDPAPVGRVGASLTSGIASFVGPRYGPTYLALPEGPGSTVRICAGDRCLDRTSTDAGPDLAMQRAGRVADLSFADFAWLCRCDPNVVGLIRVTVERGGPGVTPPPTDVGP